VRVLRSPIDSLGSVLFPASCCACSRPLLRLTRVPVCQSCWNNLPAQQDRLCAICGERLGAPAISDIDLSDELKALCPACRAQRPPFVRAVAYGEYRDTLRALIHAMKYGGMRPIADGLGRLLGLSILALADGAPPGMVVVPVPLHGQKRRQRGFNQSERLARAAIREVRRLRPEWMLDLAPVLLHRQRATESQAGLSPTKRRANLRGAFFVPKPEGVAGRDVLLIDDIYTTGATALACSQALKKAGARSVRVATMARTQRGEGLPAWQAPPSQAEIPMEEDVAFW
jgi:ComF family protein